MSALLWISLAAPAEYRLRAIAERMAACTIPVAVLHVALVLKSPRARLGGAAHSS